MNIKKTKRDGSDDRASPIPTALLLVGLDNLDIVLLLPFA